MKPRSIGVCLLTLVTIGCGDGPTAAPSAVHNSAVFSTNEQGVFGARASTAAPITIHYAQGQDGPNSLHVQWVGDVDTCVVEVWYSRYGEDVDVQISTFDTDQREIQWRVPHRFVGGRYRMRICGVLSRLMYLDGKPDDTTTRPGPVEPPYVPPTDPPVVPPVDVVDPPTDGDNTCPTSGALGGKHKHKHGKKPDPNPDHGCDNGNPGQGHA